MANKKQQLNNDLTKFVEQSQWAKAVQALQGLVDLEPANANYHLRMGDYSVKAGNKAGAVKAYYQAAHLFVDSGFAVKGIATYKMILRLAPGEKQASELMKAINSNPGVTGEAPPPAPEATPQVELAPPPIAAPAPEFEMPPPPAVAPPVEMPPPPPAPELETEMPEPPVPIIARELKRDPSATPLEIRKDINPLFAAFSKDEFGAIVDKLEPLTFIAGERIIAEGDDGDAMYLISRGGGKVIKEVEGQELVLDQLGEGEFFGEMSLLVGGPRSASVFATSDTEVLRLQATELFEVMKKYPRIENILEEFYEKRSKATRQKLNDIRK
ncbi:MAG TPA: cyclic nucleotide-binding domain-containing protein [Nitrospirales bacterium]